MKKLEVAFVWDNFGPIHADRCEAAAGHLSDRVQVLGVEIFGHSEGYEWNPEPGRKFEKITLFPNVTSSRVGSFRRTFKLLQVCFRRKIDCVFLCHYEYLATLLTAIVLRLAGRRVFVMNDSKFDDYPRELWREVAKAFYYLPYQGGMASGHRSKDYLRFLGVPKTKIMGVYNSMSIERIRALSGVMPGPAGVPFRERAFCIVARLIPKKNIETAIKAYSIYFHSSSAPRLLNIYGSGVLEDVLRKQVAAEGLSNYVTFHGFKQTAEICEAFGKSLALILPSIEEQFGNVVIESVSMGVPPILSSNCGACDTLIKSGVNGFIVEPGNAEGYAFFMNLLSEGEELWKSMSAACSQFAEAGSAVRFAEAVASLLDLDAT